MFVYLYTYYKYTQNTHMYYANKNFYFARGYSRLIIWKHLNIYICMLPSANNIIQIGYYIFVIQLLIVFF